jgi:GTP-binding protein HflX
LETTSRSLSRHGGDVLISDTVGFIRRLPARLYASFESTLAETAEASLLGIVVDSSDPEFQLHLETTHAVLNKLGAGDIPKFYVFNKADQLEEPLSDAVLRGVARGAPYRALSAHDAAAVSELSYALLDEARKDQLTEKVFVPYANTTATGRIYAQCRVLAADAMDDGVAYTIEGEAHLVRQLVMDLALGESPSNTAAERFEKEQA